MGMFEKWEENFEQWKCDNENNTDWDYVQNHIDDMNKLKEKMLNRRKILIRRREQILGIPIIDGVNLAKTYEEAEGRKKLMEERWSQADGYDIKDDFPCLNLPKNSSLYDGDQKTIAQSSIKEENNTSNQRRSLMPEKKLHALNLPLLKKDQKKGLRSIGIHDA